MPNEYKARARKEERERRQLVRKQIDPNDSRPIAWRAPAKKQSAGEQPVRRDWQRRVLLTKECFPIMTMDQRRSPKNLHGGNRHRHPGTSQPFSRPSN